MDDNSPLFQKHGQVKSKSDEMREKGRRGGYRGKGKQIHPLKIEMRELARTYGPEVVEGFLRIFRDDSVDVDMRMVAGNVILDRGFGKPVMAAPESGSGQVVVNVIDSAGKPLLPAQDAARFISDVASARVGPIMPDGEPVFERHARASDMPARCMQSGASRASEQKMPHGATHGQFSSDPNSFRGQFERAVAEDIGRNVTPMTPREKREWAEQQPRGEGE